MMAEFTTLLCCREKYALSSVWKCLRFQSVYGINRADAKLDAQQLRGWFHYFPFMVG